MDLKCVKEEEEEIKNHNSWTRAELTPLVLKTEDFISKLDSVKAETHPYWETNALLCFQCRLFPPRETART